MRNSQKEIATREENFKVRLTLFILFTIIIATVASLLTAISSNKSVRAFSAAGALILISILSLTTFKGRLSAVITLIALDLSVAAVIAIYYFSSVKTVVAIFAVAVILALGIAYIGLANKKKTAKRKIFSTKYLSYMASLTALCLIGKLLGNTLSSLIPIPTLRMSVIYIPWVISGIVLGPAGGFATALLGDIIGQLIIPLGGMPLPQYALTNAMFPVFPALCYKYLRWKKDSLKIALGMLISVSVCTMTLNTLWNSMLYGIPFWVSFVERLPQLAIIAFNYVVIISLLPSMKRIGVLNPFQQQNIKQHSN